MKNKNNFDSIVNALYESNQVDEFDLLYEQEDHLMDEDDYEDDYIEAQVFGVDEAGVSYLERIVDFLEENCPDINNISTKVGNALANLMNTVLFKEDEKMKYPSDVKNIVLESLGGENLMDPEVYPGDEDIIDVDDEDIASLIDDEDDDVNIEISDDEESEDDVVDSDISDIIDDEIDSDDSDDVVVPLNDGDTRDKIMAIGSGLGVRNECDLPDTEEFDDDIVDDDVDGDDVDIDDVVDDVDSVDDIYDEDILDDEKDTVEVDVDSEVDDEDVDSDDDIYEDDVIL